MYRRTKKILQKDKNLSELMKGSSIAFTLRVIGLLLSYIITLLVARKLGAESLGLFALSLTIMQICVTIAIFGLDIALVKFVSSYISRNEQHLVKKVYRMAINFAIPLALLITLLLLASAGPLANSLFDNKELKSTLLIAAFCIVPLVLLRTNSAVFRGMKNITVASLIQNVSAPFFMVIIFSIVVTFYPQRESAMWAQFASYITTACLSYLYLNKYIINGKPEFNNIKYKEMIAVSFPMMLTSAMAMIMSWSDVIMLGMLRSAEEVGIYAVALKLAGITAISLMAVNTIAAPKFSEFYSRNDLRGLEKTVIQSTRIIVFSTIPVILLLFIFAETILNIFGDIFVIGDITLWILMAGQIVNSISGSVGIFLTMTGNQKINMFINGTALSLNIVLNYILIPYYGIIGAAIATATSVSCQNIAKVIIIQRKYKFTPLYIPRIIHCY